MFSIIYQGPTTFYKKIPLIKKYESIFSTWEDEPVDNIEYLKSLGFKIILNKKPKNNGFHNINLQTISSLTGIKNSSEKYVLKIRSDMIIDKIDIFLDILSKDKMSFLCYHTDGYLCDYLNFGHIDDMIFWWDYIQENTSNTAPEIQLLENFLLKSFFEKNRKFDFLSKKFNFFLKDLNTNDINILWLKNNINLKNLIYESHFLY